MNREDGGDDRRYQEQVVMVDRSDTVGEYDFRTEFMSPRMMPDEWCGEWKEGKE